MTSATSTTVLNVTAEGIGPVPVTVTEHSMGPVPVSLTGHGTGRHSLAVTNGHVFVG